jgi:hypothetical protein
VQKGASREIKPLSPQDHPDIAAALEVVDLEEGPASVNAGEGGALRTWGNGRLFGGAEFMAT